MAVIEIAKIQVRRGRENVTGVPQLDPGEFGWAEDTQHLYIGKRFEEGAVNDDNTRILTESDLQNIFELIGTGGATGSVASTSTYRYRNEVPFPNLESTTTSIARKLDNFVSLTDFSKFTLMGDITDILQKAVRNLYANPALGNEPIRPLKIPAGNYAISGVVDLPPHATLIGDGPGITTLYLTSAGANMFRTVDALGNNYNGSMQNDGDASQYVHLSNMTIAYGLNNINNTPLISLDNTENSVIDNVQFTTVGAALNTSTFVSTGTAVAMRNSIGVDESTVATKNIQIKNCQFTNMKLGVTGLGLVSRPVIKNNVFMNLNEGVVLTSVSTTTPVPINTLVTKNKFNFIRQSAINVTTSTGRSNLISSDNVYYYVGNLSAIPDQLVTTSTYPVLTFNSEGNISTNDYFNRRAIANNTSTFYYNPLANKNVKISSNTTYNSTVPPSTSNVDFIKIPLTSRDQLGIIEYQLSNNNMSRKGTLTLNISPDGFASVSDYYNYSEVIDGASDQFVFSTNLTHSPYEIGTMLNYITITCSNFSALAATLEFNIDLTV
jgi:hypothetical protein